MDCDSAIKLNPDFVKAYYRKAKALYELTHVEGTAAQAISTLHQGLELAQQQNSDLDLQEEIEKMLAEAEE